MMGRHWFVVLAAVVGLGGCCESAPTVNPAGIPNTLDEVRARHAPPEVVVTVERKTRSRGSGAGGCGHSPVCIILLPALLINEAFPEKWDEATVEEGNTRVFFGRFETGGQLLSATTWTVDTVRKYDALDLKALGRRLVIESGSAPYADGKAGTFTRRSIQEQVDLVALYKARLAKTKNTKQRVALATEAMKWLGDEARDLAQAHVGAAAEADEVRAGIVAWACKPWSAWSDVGGLLEAGRKKPGPHLSVAAMRCALDDSPRKTAEAPGYEYAGEPVSDKPVAEGIDLTPYVHGLVDDVCRQGSSSPVSLADITALTKQHMDEARQRAKACKDTPRRTALKFALGMKVDAADLAAALQSDDGIAIELGGLLDAKRPDHRRALFLGLTQHPDREAYLEPLYAANVVADETEIMVAAGTVASGGSFLGTRAQAFGIALLYRARTGGTPTARARKFLEARLAKDKDAQFYAGLLALGVTRHVPAMLRAYRRYSVATSDPGQVVSNTELVTFAMTLVGCHREAQTEAWRVAMTGSKDIPKCTRP